MSKKIGMDHNYYNRSPVIKGDGNLSIPETSFEDSDFEKSPGKGTVSRAGDDYTTDEYQSESEVTIL